MWRRMFPLRCPSCATVCSGWCARCVEGFLPSSDQSVPPGLDALWCPFVYQGAVKKVVLAAKATPAHGWLGVMGASLPFPPGFSDGCPVVITWATGSAAHRRRRGYDPAERIARSYGRRHRIRVVDMLQRCGGPQEGQSAADRATLRFLANPRGSAGAVRGTVLVVDDVVTTGATMTQAARALRSVGVSSVIGVCFARRELT